MKVFNYHEFMEKEGKTLGLKETNSILKAKDKLIDKKYESSDIKVLDLRKDFLKGVTTLTSIGVAIPIAKTILETSTVPIGMVGGRNISPVFGMVDELDPNTIITPLFKYIKWILVGVSCLACTSAVLGLVASQDFDKVIPTIIVFGTFIIVGYFAPKILQGLATELEKHI